MPTIRVITSVKQAPPEIFAQSKTPFMSQAFWQALEDSDAISPERGWWAQHLLLHNEAQQPIALLPLFAKNHHRGEYVFDQNWAQAYKENGLNYYPRLVSCIPFTPVTDERIWLANGIDLEDVLPMFVQGIKQLATQQSASSWHTLFLTQADAATFAKNQPKLAFRQGCQFLWTDHKFDNFDGFLSQMTAKRRKTIKAERNKIHQMGISCHFIEGKDIQADDWIFFYQCYQRTYHVRGQSPYLSLAFFEQIGLTMPNNVVLEIAQDSLGKKIAAALFFKDADTLYGRYWGSLSDVACLHFEVCYYQGITYALAQGLTHFDPGTQGEHKLLRGFSPVLTHSAHWLAHPQFMQAIHEYTELERQHIGEYHRDAMVALPFKHNINSGSG
ncbi:GNAT family N-acetyltransferase [Hydromonas duriensis]|nr:GNAT family N-acetyltransferase [Hydromonas duriensis]